MNIGEKIKYYRVKNQMTQEKLAAELNISFQAVSKWERSESLPDVTLISKLAEVLNVTCDAILTDNDCFAESEIDLINVSSTEKCQKGRIPCSRGEIPREGFEGRKE